MTCRLLQLVDVIYLFGGYYNGALKRMDIYLPSVGVFCPAGSAADMPYALYSMDAGALPYRQHHYIYVAGGLKTPNTTSPDGAFSSQTLAYDPFSEGALSLYTLTLSLCTLTLSLCTLTLSCVMELGSTYTPSSA